MKKVMLSVVASALFASAGTWAHDVQGTNEPSKTPVDRSVQVYRMSNLQQWNREKAGGGEGRLLGRFAYTRHQTGEQDAIREIGWLTLPPGASIGLHKHTNNEDVYLIVEGRGTFMGTDGKEVPVSAGDITIARPGQSHALKNTGRRPLRFINFIGQLPSTAPAAPAAR
ncbi:MULTISPECIES: cupin domain-containing protein [Eikenella]|uniref:Cupin domain-containing protein n=1 Tax=Eikenella exigua TaxID=2528037 RepID=A0AAX1F9M3_9NEIS|nr:MULTISPECIES: cupin domain-containing protein [Eikenella]OAM28182.1 cupin [Eikenella sp. NML01-A-086]OAM41955.1 cupin [Eikenella sp. NML97-A-109]QED92780.1 cupin domain-containing protein [Eikenella exigua]